SAPASTRRDTHSLHDALPISLSVEKDMLYVYAYALLYEWELVFPEKMEITEGELNQLQFAACFGWNRQTENDVLQLLVDRNIIGDRKSTRLNSSHVSLSYAVF